MWVNRALWLRIAAACLGVATCGDATPTPDDSDSRAEVLTRDASRDISLQDGGDDLPEEDAPLDVPGEAADVIAGSAVEARDPSA